MVRFLSLAIAAASLSAGSAADPCPHCAAQTPDPPPVVSRAEFDGLAGRIARLEAAVGLGTAKVAPVATAPTVTVAPVVVSVAPRPAVRTGLPVSTSHNCPSCGAGPWYVQSGSSPQGHTHTCGRCGTVFAHREDVGPSSAAAPVRYQTSESFGYSIRQSAGRCLNGVCPTSQQPEYLFAPFGGRFRP